MTDKFKDIEGAVNVNGDITPITRKPINQVNAAQWHEMSIGDLVDQRATLQSRLISAHSSGHSEMAVQIQRGIAGLDALISSQQTDEIGLT